MNIPRNVVPASAFRNVSYQRATHESLMGDNQSTVNDMTVCQDTTAVNSVSENNKPTVENPKVRQLTTACFVVFDRYEFY